MHSTSKRTIQNTFRQMIDVLYGYVILTLDHDERIGAAQEYDAIVAGGSDVRDAFAAALQAKADAGNGGKAVGRRTTGFLQQHSSPMIAS